MSMSFAFDLLGKAVQAVTAARSAARVVGHESPVLDELHQGLSPFRRHLTQERAQELGAQLATPAPTPPAPTPPESAAPGGDGDGDIADLLDSDGGGLGEAIAGTGDGGGGLIAGAVD